MNNSWAYTPLTHNSRNSLKDRRKDKTDQELINKIQTHLELMGALREVVDKAQLAQVYHHKIIHVSSRIKITSNIKVWQTLVIIQASKEETEPTQAKVESHSLP